MIKKILAWWSSVAGKNPWFTYDKFAHFALHIIIVRGIRTHLGFHWWIAWVISITFGLLYEVITTDDWNDSWKDIVWNTIGGIVGVAI